MASTSDEDHLRLASIDKKPIPRQNTSLAFIQSKLRRFSGGPSGGKTLSAVDIKGPLGLTLLHEPSEPRIDFIFVHGLFGGSRRTWSYSQEQGMFWPKEWLPNEVGFRHIRLHSYGYNSGGSMRESLLTVHDFAQALLADIYNSPELRKNGDAYLLALNDSIYKRIGNRIHTTYFLGTPHRGADLAQIQTNDEFRHVCNNPHLWSFFEGAPTVFGPLSSLVVKKESAILGLPGEHIQASSRYRSLAINEKQHQGSCQWLTADEVFQRWINGPDRTRYAGPPQQTSSEIEEDVKILWLTGRPGTGKSVVSGHVVRYLEDCNLDCSFYFFRHSDNAGSTIAALLQSLAFQMAESSYEVRRAIVSLIEDGVRLSHGDHHMLWTKLFV
ncbi:hypothetical protein CHGG_02196 [Chaetomium globosum CBS 148.51]|uniref:Nephrocystin 3-like N-terminal domain-containing protein n=1 Tax=Chaetomium globosum (strain ATCC 6205 / CBS 148.51 / DSM 1962 / NBRC 6347 / NRRL 1970) TaxID=306901 RepID=Q2HC58_CHAGB|nr:uncharacterized protein CHGG_02196 [Chaetomium globosum CBS 148.51]EAQ90261.1 hypothetical protein CHGG_02196 [Chaetomium globosum CBS 148.51]